MVCTILVTILVISFVSSSQGSVPVIPRILSIRTGKVYGTWRENPDDLIGVGTTFSIPATDFPDGASIVPPDVLHECGGMWKCFSSKDAGSMRRWAAKPVTHVVPSTIPLANTDHTVTHAQRWNVKEATICHEVAGMRVCHADVESPDLIVVKTINHGLQITLNVICHYTSLNHTLFGCHVLYPGEIIFTSGLHNFEEGLAETASCREAGEACVEGELDDCCGFCAQSDANNTGICRTLPFCNLSHHPFCFFEKTIGCPNLHFNKPPCGHAEIGI